MVLANALVLAALQTLPPPRRPTAGAPAAATPATLVFPAGVAAAEFLITRLSPFGTAYGSLAVTQHADLPLLQVVSVTGPWLCLAALAALTVTTTVRPRRPPGG
ncbi:hypothetical protein AB0L59_23040 [Streptomyces sp. NPDC052109]|uniref:hypothetical protein n=1 Tax=Streptomyces sp. NPDC052109 TaxID=3155527 RepID=UPI0034432E7E